MGLRKGMGNRTIENLASEKGYLEEDFLRVLGKRRCKRRHRSALQADKPFASPISRESATRATQPRPLLLLHRSLYSHSPCTSLHFLGLTLVYLRSRHLHLSSFFRLTPFFSLLVHLPTTLYTPATHFLAASGIPASIHASKHLVQASSRPLQLQPARSAQSERLDVTPSTAPRAPPSL
jgi:hypothetical protein